MLQKALIKSFNTVSIMKSLTNGCSGSLMRRTDRINQIVPIHSSITDVQGTATVSRGTGNNIIRSHQSQIDYNDRGVGTSVTTTVR